MITTTGGEMLERTADDFSVAAVQLIEAACSAQAGDCEMAKMHIAQALELIHGRRSRGQKFAVRVLDGAAQTPAARVLDGAAAQARTAHLLDGAAARAPAARLLDGAARAPAPAGCSLAEWQARRLIAYIDGHLEGTIRVKDLATLLGFSAGHFCRVFKCTFGISAHAYVLRRRIELSKRLMLTTETTLSDIALSCGMGDQSHFTRSFRRIVGETPHAWRRNRRGALKVGKQEASR
jgi:AraC family transcriptional regulator